MSQKNNDPNSRVELLLKKIHNLWSRVNTNDEGYEIRYPDNGKEIRKSRKLLKKIKSLDFDDNYLQSRIDNVEKTLDIAEANLPKYKSSVLVAILFSLIGLIAIWFLISINTYKYPEISYNPDWFVTIKSTDLLWNTVDPKEDETNVKTKVHLPKGSKLKPIALINREYFQVETADGQRGFVPFTVLKGADKAKTKKTVWTFKKIGGQREDTIPAETIVRVIDRELARLNYKNVKYLKVKLDNGRVRWVMEKDFQTLIFDSIPQLNPEYKFLTTDEAINKNIIGDTLSNIEARYGPATSYFKTKNTYQAYFKQLHVFGDKNKYEGIIVTLNKNNVADTTQLMHRRGRHFYDKIFLVYQLKSLEITKIFNYSFYLDNIPKMQWWQNFKDYSGWLTRSIAWIIKMGVYAILLILFFSMGRMIAAPFMQLFSYTKFLNNSTVKVVNFILIFAFTIPLYLYVVLIAEQWFFVGILAAGTAYFFYSIHSSTIDYERCPACHTMYAAVDMGTSKDGVSKFTSSEKVNDYIGTTVSYSGNTQINTKHYLTRNKRTTNVYQKYTDYRICKRCDCEWSIGRAEKIGSSTSYD